MYSEASCTHAGPLQEALTFVCFIHDNIFYSNFNEKNFTANEFTL